MFWQIKNAEKPGISSLLHHTTDRDSYDRCDFYNAYGIAVFYILKLRKGFFKFMQHDIVSWEGFDLVSDQQLTFLQPHSPEYILEMFQPLLLVTSQSKSETIKALSAETLQMLVYFCQEKS